MAYGIPHFLCQKYSEWVIEKFHFQLRNAINVLVTYCNLYIMYVCTSDGLELWLKLHSEETVLEEMHYKRLQI